MNENNITTPTDTPIQFRQNSTLEPNNIVIHNFSGKKLFLSIISTLLFFIISATLITINYYINPLKTSKISFYDTTTKQLKTTVNVTNPEENFRLVRGIRNKKDIPDGTGVIFKFDHPSNSPYWMKDMLFSIDIIWVDNNKVVDFAQNLKVPFPNQPPESLRLYKPTVPASSAIEVKAGFIKKYGILKGDQITEIILK